MDQASLRQRDFWRAFAPELHLEEPAAFSPISGVAFSQSDAQAMAELMRVEGYFQATGVGWQVDVARMADAVRRLDASGLSPAFAFLYDEFWIPYYKLHPLYQALLGGSYFMLPDFWAWNVDPKRGDSGWSPHRDKGWQSLLPDGMPKSITTWIALSPATPLNGCMYVVPAHLDPCYGRPNDIERKFEYSSIRALPASPGDFFIWNQAVLHWGSRSSPRGGESRVSMAFEFQRADMTPYNDPLIAPLQFLTFEMRLKLIAKQILQYRHMYKVDPNIEQMAIAIGHGG